MPDATDYPPGAQVWLELVTADPRAAAAFYTRIFNWQVHAPVPAYRFCLQGDLPVTAIVNDAYHRGQASGGWLPGFFVPDLDEACRRAVQHGGTVPVAPAAEHGKGRHALVRDPGGTECTLWGAGHLPDPKPVRTPGHRWKTELSARDPLRSTAFYVEVLGGGTKRSEKPGGVNRLTARDGLPLFDVTPSPAGTETDRWVTHFVVRDLTSAVRTVTDGGGEVEQADAACSTTIRMADLHRTPSVLLAL
ncbi:VOC family protein [Streptomyces sp. NPDC088752]|uniref:VOC family protein n=1 Tax=Streptomyces sp. NPDC088752 TaxID=3154963 RepID=UPI003413CDCF